MRSAIAIVISGLQLASSVTALAQTGTAVTLGGPLSTCRLTACKVEIKVSPTGEEQAFCVARIGTCSGTLISPTEVLTAAHCVDGLEDRTKRVMVQCGYTGFDATKSPAAAPPPPEQDDPTVAIQANFEAAQFTEQVFVGKVTIHKDFITQADTAQKEKGKEKGQQIVPGLPFLFRPRVCVPDFEAEDRYYEQNATQVEEEKKENGPGAGADIAVLTLKKPSTKIASASIGSAARYFDAKGPRTGTECMISGFGMGGAGASGLLKSGPVTTDFGADLEDLSIGKITKFQIGTKEQIPLSVLKYLTYNGMQTMSAEELSNVILYLNSKKLFSVQMLPGASGGPLYCRASKNEAWEVVGVNDAIALRSECARKFEDESVEMKLRLYNIWGIPELSKVTRVLADYTKPAAAAAAK